MTETLYSVAVDSPLKEALTYLAPANGLALSRGEPVTVPLGKRQARGVILGLSEGAPEGARLRAIVSRDDERPTIPGSYMDWVEWLGRYYLFPVGKILESVYPPLTKRTGRTSKKSPVVKDHPQASTPPPLTDEQAAVVKAIRERPGFQPHLLFGVTGSGKTEVYLRLLERTLERGRQGLVLVPEISLTPQLIDRFSRRFPGQVAVLHSHLTPREKTTQWWSAVSGDRNILIGARSALFCPLPRLDLIVLDEEHEPSYKQDEQLKYHARDAAVMLARFLDIPIVLGSATPSFESWNNAVQGKYLLHRMRERVNARPLPTLEVVDLREVYLARREEGSSLPHWLSDRLHEELVSTLEKNEQAAIFLNRRGVGQTAQCHACGFSCECPNCSVSLTVHAKSHLVCHYCDYTERLSETCPECKQAPLEVFGLGTERIEVDLRALFPQARLARADRDEIQTREQLEVLIADVEARRVDFLVGTQMIAKGLDFPHLNLVGLVLADIGFHWPDFRSSERSYQLLTQVSGRAGRQSPGRVVIQTYNPNHPSIRATLAGNFAAFAEEELRDRAELNYPPAWRMAMFRIHGPDKTAAERTADRLVERARAIQRSSVSFTAAIHVLGPAEAPLFKLRNRFRYQVLVKCDKAARLNEFARRILGDERWFDSGTKVQIDIDPIQML